MEEIELRLAKASKSDVDSTLDFLNAAEQVLEREKFSLKSPEDQWLEWDDEDEDKILMLKIRKRIADYEEIREGDIDNRILAYEFMKEKFAACSCNWRRVVFSVLPLIEAVCDPMKRHLVIHPGFDFNHVDKEQ